MPSTVPENTHQHKFKQTYSKIKVWIKCQLAKVAPGSIAVEGAAKALVGLSFLFYIIYAVKVTIDSGDLWLLLFFTLLSIVFYLTAYTSTWLIEKVMSVPKIYRIAMLVSGPLLFFALGFEAIYWLFAVLLFSCLGAVIAIFAKSQFTSLTRLKKSITLLGASAAVIGGLAAVYSFYVPGFSNSPVVNAAALNSDSVNNIAAESPTTVGQYKVKRFTYGSGTDIQREQFGEQVAIKTNTVDGTVFIDGWSGFNAWYREKFWGFGVKQLPLNAQVWIPEGNGPFPLILMVHGNHFMQDFSDGGYAYLGELLASRGIIFASVDQNFINGSWSDIGGGLSKENDARGWLLLEHLRLWHEWNADSNSELFGKVDTDKLGLVGHSRGGEAVAHAALLNKMPLFYDDASHVLDYNFNIKAIVAIAPVDGQYKPGKSYTALEDINYFTMHGSQDGDVTSFAGSKQYERVSFSPESDFFKASLYVQNANHGQFNSTWGANDTMSPTKLLNNKDLLSSADQTEIAKTYISAFFGATLLNQKHYVPLFLDARKGKDWLPETIYLSQFETSEFYNIASFDEDFNVLTTSKGGNIIGKNLSVWREQEVQLAWREKGTRAVYLGWREFHNAELENSAEAEIEASYSLSLKQSPVVSLEDASLVFSMAPSNEANDPKSSGKWLTNNVIATQSINEKLLDEANAEQQTLLNNINNADVNNGIEKDDSTDNSEDDPIDFTITITDKNLASVSFPLSNFSALQASIDIRIWKSQFISGDSQSENIFQTFVFPLRDIQALNPDLNLQLLETITFTFNKTPKGVVIIDRIGFMKNIE